MKKRYKITVMLGGPSAEREVSLRTGAAVAKALRNRGHEVFELDPTPGHWCLPENTDVVFLALHGTYGEDGTIQKEIQRLDVPYTGCGPEASRIAFDKILAKESFEKSGIQTPRYAVVSDLASKLPSNLKLPLVVKPARQGSSVGLAFVDEARDWEGALKEALKHDSEVLVEERVAGRETTVGILAGQALPLVEVRPKKGSYDYTNKYTAGATEYFCPAEFPAEVTRLIQQEALKAFKAIGGQDYARVDVMVSKDNKPMVLEVNTLPGMTETSLLPKAAAAAGLNYEDLCERMIELALTRKVPHVV